MTVRRIKGAGFEGGGSYPERARFWACSTCITAGRSSYSVDLNEGSHCKDCGTPVDLDEPRPWRFYATKRQDGVHFGIFADREYQQATETQASQPVRVGASGEDTYWWFGGRFYLDDDGLTAEEVRAVVLDRERKRKAQIDRAIAQHDLPPVEETAGRRTPIPDQVKLFVWRRDEGECVRCGSREKLEFDHIIPRNMGGSDTARNIQLLCEPCNRAKGGELV